MRLSLFLFLASLSLSSAAQQYYLFIGTYTGSGSKGIYVYRFDAATGKATWVSNTDSAANPSYLAIAPGGNYLYAVNETGGAQPGSLSAYRFNKGNGQLTFINQQPTGGDHPCYVSVDKSGQWAVVGNYSGGNVSALRISENGSLEALAQSVQHSGRSANKQRQEKAHVHAAVFSPDEKYVYVPDLGTDNVMIYAFKKDGTKPLQSAAQAFASSKPGSGPRHFTFHPNGKFAYLVEELSGTVAVYRHNAGRLSFLQRISSHPKDYKGAYGSADIHVSPDGKFLYASNRGDANSITVFTIGADGKLVWQGYQSTLGTHPRNFMIDPTGAYLLVANRDTNNVVIFKRNKETGLLEDTGERIEIPKPVCLKMMK